MKIFMIAGEPSGDKLGAAAMAGLKSLRDEIQFRGVGGTEMMSEGLPSQFDMSELSVMGLLEVLPKYTQLKRRIKEVAEAIVDWQPDVVVTIDSPDFCLRVADSVKAQSDIRICHYVAPTVWAWRPERAAKMAKRVDQVLALFPFEPPYFEEVGLRCDFVGHPVVSEGRATDKEVAQFRERHAQDGAPLVLLLPGSRKGEIRRLAPIFGKCAEEFSRSYPKTQFVVPSAQGVEELLRDEIENWSLKPLIISAEDRDQKRSAMRACDFALAASGTVALELAANGTPMVSAYKMQWLTQKIVERKALIDTANLVNIITDSRVVPEFLGDLCDPQLIQPALKSLYASSVKQDAALSATMEALGFGGEAPGLRAAKAILDGCA